MNSNPKFKESNSKRYELQIENNSLKNVTKETVFELIRDIKDPEHPYSLEKLDVVNLEDIKIYEITEGNELSKIGLPLSVISVEYKPTIPNCSMAALIGLCIRIKLERFIDGYWIKVNIKEGTHVNYEITNIQLNDKDRVLAALENENLMSIIDDCLS